MEVVKLFLRESHDLACRCVCWTFGLASRSRSRGNFVSGIDAATVRPLKDPGPLSGSVLEGTLLFAGRRLLKPLPLCPVETTRMSPKFSW